MGEGPKSWGSSVSSVTLSLVSITSDSTRSGRVGSQGEELAVHTTGGGAGKEQLKRDITSPLAPRDS